MEKGNLKILAVGDVVGACGVEVLKKRLGGIVSENKIDLVIVNGENSAVDNGIDKSSAESIFRYGGDVITTGNHVYKKSSAHSLLENCEKVIRPANYPGSCPGCGYGIYDACGYKVLVINLLGTVYLESLSSPFETVDKILDREEGKYDLCFVDFHAEATSEKAALAHYLDGRVTAVFGTHTHVQTADERILNGGTAFITDLGMCGAEDSVLGVKKEIIIRRFLTKMPARHEESDLSPILCGCIFTVNTTTQRCVSVQRLYNREC